MNTSGKLFSLGSQAMTNLIEQIDLFVMSGKVFKVGFIIIWNLVKVILRNFVKLIFIVFGCW